jgi:hypothetical protein
MVDLSVAIPVVRESEVQTEGLVFVSMMTQTSAASLDFPSAGQRRFLASIVGRNPVYSPDDVLRDFVELEGPLSTTEVSLTMKVIDACIQSTAFLARQVRQEVQVACEHRADAVANLRGVWYQLGEYEERGDV